MLGFSYDWDREVDTTDPEYFKWTQWIFLQLYKKGLAYEAEVPVVVVRGLQGVLANEEVNADGTCDRKGHKEVFRRPLRQWMLQHHARMRSGCWRTWKRSTGRSRSRTAAELDRPQEGAEVDFAVAELQCGVRMHEGIRVFTTRPDTLFGATYMVLAPEHRWSTRSRRRQQKAAVESLSKAAATQERT